VQTEKPKRYEIFNKTPRRIAIRARRSNEGSEEEYLVISPFSTKVVSEDAMHAYEYQRWEQEDLIDVNEVVASTDDSLSSVGLSVGCGVWLVIYLVVGLIVPLSAPASTPGSSSASYSWSQ